MAAEEVDVLVVGAGPAGLTAAATLARYGVVVQVVERKQRLSIHPRATVVSTRSMELLRSWGLEEEIKAGGMPGVEWLALVTETLADADRGELATLGLPTKEQAAVLSPTAPLCAPQHHTEAVLLAHARSFGGEVVCGQEVLRVDVGDEGAEALIREGDRTRAVSARYVIGADGARSIVRSALGIEMVGPGEIDTVSVSVAFSARLWDLVGERRYGLYPIVRPDISSVFVPSGAGDHWVFGIGEDLVGSMEAPELTGLIRTAAGVPDLQPRIHQIRRFKFAAEIAERFSSASAFLIGDAAHRVTPRGGTGMNTAIADGYDLGWKLGWVLKKNCSTPTRPSAVRWSSTTSSARSTSGVRTGTRSTSSTSTSEVGLRTSGSRRRAGVSRRSTSSATGSHCSRARIARLASKLPSLSTAPRRLRFGNCRR
jgi:putative polyketide hydroxylase